MYLYYIISFPIIAILLLYNIAEQSIPVDLQKQLRLHQSPQYILPSYIHEQESKSQLHLVHIAHQVQQFNAWNQKNKSRRELIFLLPNVGESRISSCSAHPYDYYYGEFPIKMKYLPQRNYIPSKNATSMIVTLFPDFRRLTMNTTRPMCMDGEDKLHVVRETLPKHKQLATMYVNKLDLRSITQEPDMLLLDWHLPTLNVSLPMIPYHRRWEELALNTTGSNDYVGLHWR